MDGVTYQTKDWSLGGVLLSRYRGKRHEGEDIDGKLSILAAPEHHPFKGVIIRRRELKDELAIRFTELSEAAFTLLEHASIGRERQDWAFR